MTEQEDEIRLKDLLDIYSKEQYKEIIEILNRDQKRYHKEQLTLSGVVDSKRFTDTDLLNGYQAGCIEQINGCRDLGLDYLKEIKEDGKKWVKRYTEQVIIYNTKIRKRFNASYQLLTHVLMWVVNFKKKRIMKKVLLVLVILLGLNTVNAQSYKLKGIGMSKFAYIFTDSTITATQKGKVLKVTKGFVKKVKSDKVNEYYKTDEDGNKQRWQVVEMSKKNVLISITIIDSFTEEKTKSNLMAKRVN